MLTLEEAKKLALAALLENSRYTADDIAFIDERIQCKRYGWVLIYNHRKYVETGDILYAFGGNGPIVVMHDGTLHSLGTAQTIEGNIAQFEREHGLS